MVLRIPVIVIACRRLNNAVARFISAQWGCADVICIENDGYIVTQFCYRGIAIAITMRNNNNGWTTKQQWLDNKTTMVDNKTTMVGQQNNNG